MSSSTAVPQSTINGFPEFSMSGIQGPRRYMAFASLTSALPEVLGIQRSPLVFTLKKLCRHAYRLQKLSQCQMVPLVDALSWATHSNLSYGGYTICRLISGIPTCFYGGFKQQGQVHCTFVIILSCPKIPLFGNARKNWEVSCSDIGLGSTRVKTLSTRFLGARCPSQ